MDTEYISRASRALAAMTLVRQAAANEVAVLSGAEYETWIGEHRINYWAMAGWITVVIMACCILVGLVLLWWKSRGVAETIDSGTQTLEEGRCSQDVPTRIMVTKHGKAAHRRNDCPFFLRSHVIQSLSWCSVFSLRSKSRFGKARLEAAHWVLRTSVEPQSVLYQFPVSQIPAHSCTQDVPCCTHPARERHLNATRANVSCARLRQASAPPVVLVSTARQCGSVSVLFVGTSA